MSKIKMRNIPNIPTEIMTNRINIAFRDCLQIEIESNELKFSDVKKEILDLLKIVKKDLLDAEKKPNEHEVA